MPADKAVATLHTARRRRRSVPWREVITQRAGCCQRFAHHISHAWIKGWCSRERASPSFRRHPGPASPWRRAASLRASADPGSITTGRRVMVGQNAPVMAGAVCVARSTTQKVSSMRIEPVFLFDLDGTLVDSVYQHVLAWKAALDSENIELSVWRIHRKIGMSGGLFINQLLRETSVPIDPARAERLRRAHAEAYQAYARDIRPLPGARELLAFLSSADIPWAIATSARMDTAAVNLAALGVDPAHAAVVTRDEVKYAKPDPDLFLAAAAN